MILSEQAIRAELSSGRLKIAPPPDEAEFDSDSVGVHLGEKIYSWQKPGGGAKLSVPLWTAKQEGGFEYKGFSREHLKVVAPDDDGIITMRPGRFYIADLKQSIQLPNDLAAMVQGKSTLARLGVIVHLTSPHAHAGWTGTLTLEMANLGPLDIQLKAGMSIGQLTFWRVEQPVGQDEDVTGGSFSGQEDARGNTDSRT